jgi:glucose/arabinose dehydrogenase
MVLAFACAAQAATAADPATQVRVPSGFRIETWALVPNARSMALGDDGTVFVGTRKNPGDVYAVRDEGGERRVRRIAQGLNVPNGVAYRAGALYVAEINRILRYDGIESRLDSPPAPAVVYDKLPRELHHGWKFIDFGPDGRLYVPIGAPCNVCDRDRDGYAVITRMNPDGSGFEVYARGVRNSVGFAWHPRTGELWFTDNGRDLLGDDVPDCELNRAPRSGMHFGFPFCHAGDVVDPEFGALGRCSEAAPPALKLGPHVAPLGLEFYTGTQFPAEYRGQLFVAEHGSWNRSRKIGYQVVLVRLDGERVVGQEPFATGWLRPDESVIGRPVDLLQLRDGSLLLSDDSAGRIYRITYEAPAKGR